MVYCWRKGYMKRIQISHNIVDEDLLKEVKRYMIAPW